MLGFRGDLASRGSAVEEVGNCYAAARQLSGSPQGRTSTLPHNWPAWSPATASLAWASIGPARSCGSAARRGGPGNADPGGRHQAADRGRAAGCRTGRGRVVEQAHRQAPVRVSTHGGSPPHPRPSQARSPPPGRLASRGLRVSVIEPPHVLRQAAGYDRAEGTAPAMPRRRGSAGAQFWALPAARSRRRRGQAGICCGSGGQQPGDRPRVGIQLLRPAGRRHIQPGHDAGEIQAPPWSQGDRHAGGLLPHPGAHRHGAATCRGQEAVPRSGWRLRASR